MPYEVEAARNWMDRAERSMRKNGRVIDKLRIALPRELDDHQRTVLVERFMGDLTGGSVPWFAAIHQEGKDVHNPHVHIAIHDRDITTNRRVLRLSDSARDRVKAGLPGPKAVQWVRERWEVVCNDALAEAGHDIRIDRRTLNAQGIKRKPGIHEGPRAAHIEGHVRRPISQKRINGCGRVIDYPAIDHGRTRREFNAHIIDFNLEQVARLDHPETALWAQYERHQSAKDRQLEKTLAIDAYKRTKAYRAASHTHLAKIKKCRKQRDRDIEKERAAVRKVFVPKREGMQQAQANERLALADKQSRLRARLLRHLDITGLTRRKQQAERKALAAKHRKDRKALTETYYAIRNKAVVKVKTKCADQVAAIEQQRLGVLVRLRETHVKAEQLAEVQRQQREIAREHARQITERKIAVWRKARKGAQPLGKESALAKVLQKASKYEADRQDRESGDDFDHER